MKRTKAPKPKMKRTKWVPTSKEVMLDEVQDLLIKIYRLQWKENYKKANRLDKRLARIQRKLQKQ